MSPVEADTRSALAERYRVLLDIGRTLTGTLSPEELYRAIHRETARVLEAEGFYISLFEEARDRATIVYCADDRAHPQAGATYRGSDSDVIRTRKGTLVEDRAALRCLEAPGEDVADITRSTISAPLLHEGRVLGAIGARSYRSKAYGAEDLELLQGIADIAAVAVENARFVAELERQRREAEKIEEIGRALASSLDPQEVLEKIMEAVLALMEVDHATVWLRGDGATIRAAASGGRTRIPDGAEWDLSGPLFQRLVEERLPVVIDDLAASGDVPPHLREHLATGAGLAVPLVVAGDVAGTLSAGSDRTVSFRDDDVRLLRRLASQASVALENARLHAGMQALSLTDPLTGLPNRRHLQIHLEREVAAARRGRDVVVVLMDLDNFKGYNDAMGHLAGDDALRAFSQLLADENRAMNLVARYGGDEFVSILSESTPEGAAHYVRRLHERVSEDPVLGPAGITVSAGTAAFDRETMTRSEDVLQAADSDLYRNKVHR